MEAMITLINPPGIKSFSGLQMHSPNPPIGVAYIAAAVKEAGFPYKVIDGTGEAIDTIRPYPGRKSFMVQGLLVEEIVKRIPSQTDIVGIGCMFSTLWPLTRMIAQRIRERFSKVLIVIGGEHATAVPEYVLAHSPFDVCVLGEGEETFIHLIKTYRAGEDFSQVAGIAYLKNGKLIKQGLSERNKEVDKIPSPDWDSVPIEQYIERHQINGANLGRSMPLLATRGCPYACAFCSNPAMWTRTWIPRNPKHVVDEIEGYVKKYQIKNVDFQDLTAIIRRSWVVEFAQELINRNLNITWQMPSGTRSEVFDEGIADILYRSGCRCLAFAPESGSPEMLKIIRKQVDLDKMLVSMKIAIKRGLKLSCFIVIGFPDETKKTLNQTMRLIRKMALLGVYDVSVSKFVPYPGSQFFDRLQKEGKIDLDDKFFISPMDFYDKAAPSYADQISTRRLYWTMIWMYVNFYVISFATKPLRTLKILLEAVTEKREETRYAKWLVDQFFVRRHWKKTVLKRASL